MRRRLRKFIRWVINTVKVGAVVSIFVCAPLPLHLGAYAPGVRSVSMRAFDWRGWLFEGE